MVDVIARMEVDIDEFAKFASEVKGRGIRFGDEDEFIRCCEDVFGDKFHNARNIEASGGIVEVVKVDRPRVMAKLPESVRLRLEREAKSV